jgi:hypothetical protein
MNNKFICLCLFKLRTAGKPEHKLDISSEISIRWNTMKYETAFFPVWVSWIECVLNSGGIGFSEIVDAQACVEENGEWQRELL